MYFLLVNISIDNKKHQYLSEEIMTDSKQEAQNSYDSNNISNEQPTDAMKFKSKLFKQVEQVYNTKSENEIVRNTNLMFAKVSNDIISALPNSYISETSKRQISHALTQLETAKDFATRALLFNGPNYV